MPHFLDQGGAPIRRRHDHGPVDADHAHGDLAGLRQTLHVDTVERVNRQAGHLDDHQTHDQDQRRAGGEATRPEAKGHIRSTIAANT